MIGAAVLLTLVAITAFGPFFYPIDPLDIVGAPFTAPGADAWLGTDYLGRDELAGLIHGGRATLTDLIFPDAGDRALSLYDVGSQASVVSLDAWNLKK